jgi:hypothetical protein
MLDRLYIWRKAKMLFARGSSGHPIPKQYSIPFRGASSNEVVSQIENYCKSGHDFNLIVGPSTIPNAGLGVFVQAREDASSDRTTILKRGTVVALYPGVVYEPPHDPVFFQSIFNHYVLQRKDGIFIDGKHSGNFPLLMTDAEKCLMTMFNSFHSRRLISDDV